MLLSESSCKYRYLVCALNSLLILIDSIKKIFMKTLTSHLKKIFVAIDPNTAIFIQYIFVGK